MVTGAGWNASAATAGAAPSAAIVAAAVGAEGTLPATTVALASGAQTPASVARPSTMEGITAVLQSLAADVAKLMTQVAAMEQTQDVLMMDDADLDGTAEERNVRRRTEG